MTIRISFLLLLGCLGCVSAPDVAHPDLDLNVPQSYLHQTDSAYEVDTDWWRSFEDKELEQVIQSVLQNSADLKKAVARLRRAAVEAKIAGADLTPSLDFNFNASRRRQNFIGFPISGGGGKVLSSTTNSFGISLDTSWELDLWGRLRAGAQAAQADFQAEAAVYQGVRLSLVGQTLKAWFAAAEACQQKALAQETVDSFRLSTEQVRSRYQQGLKSPLDLRLSLSNLAGAEALLAQRNQQLDGAKAQLEVLLGIYPGSTVKAPTELPGLPGEIPSGLPAELVSRRPDLAAAERRLTSALSRVKMSQRALYPRISLTASGGTASDDLSDLLDGDFRVWALAGNLTQPIFHGGRLRAEVEKAETVMDESLADYTLQVLQAFSEVESALAAEVFLAQAEVHLAEAAQQSEAARLLAEDRYRSGLEDYITVLESQRRALQSQSTLIEYKRRRLDNRVDLFMALGGGYETGQEKAPSREDCES